MKSEDGADVLKLMVSDFYHLVCRILRVRLGVLKLLLVPIFDAFCFIYNGKELCNAIKT